MLNIDKNSDKLFDFPHAECTWMIGKRHPITDCRNVTIPDTKNIVDIMYPLAGSSSLQGNRINFWQLSQKYILPDTKCRTKNERNWESSPYHCKKMLKSKKKTHSMEEHHQFCKVFSPQVTFLHNLDQSWLHHFRDPIRNKIFGE